MKESEFIKLNLKFEISNVCTNVKVKITNLRTAVRQLANTLTVRKFKKRIIVSNFQFSLYSKNTKIEFFKSLALILFKIKSLKTAEVASKSRLQRSL
jgi:hypothetical protein